MEMDKIKSLPSRSSQPREIDGRADRPYLAGSVLWQETQKQGDQSWESGKVSSEGDS